MYEFAYSGSIRNWITVAKICYKGIWVLFDDFFSNLRAIQPRDHMICAKYNPTRRMAFLRLRKAIYDKLRSSHGIQNWKLHSVIILCMGAASQWRLCIVLPYFIYWAFVQTDPCAVFALISRYVPYFRFVIWCMQYRMILRLFAPIYSSVWYLTIAICSFT